MINTFNDEYTEALSTPGTYLVRLVSGFPSAIGRADVSAPMQTDPGVIINHNDDSQITVGSGESLYIRSYSGLVAVDITEVESNGGVSINTLQILNDELQLTTSQGTFTLNLTPYLDDTNLSRLVAGSLDAATGVLTVTRDDGTEFDIDQSSFTDEINSINQKLSPYPFLPDPSANEGRTYALQVVGGVYQPREIFKDSASRSDPILNQSIVPFSYLSLGSDLPVTGIYSISWSFLSSYNSTTNNYSSNLVIDRGTPEEQVIRIANVENADSSGLGTDVPSTTGVETPSGTDNLVPYSGDDIELNLAAGPHAFEIEFNGQSANNEAVMYRAKIKIELNN